MTSHQNLPSLEGLLPIIATFDKKELTKIKLFVQQLLDTVPLEALYKTPLVIDFNFYKLLDTNKIVDKQAKAEDLLRLVFNLKLEQQRSLDLWIKYLTCNGNKKAYANYIHNKTHYEVQTESGPKVLASPLHIIPRKSFQRFFNPPTNPYSRD